MKQSGSNYLIVVGGPGASGSSTISKRLSEYFNIERVYAGQIFRDKAVEMGYTNVEDFLVSVTKAGFYLDNEVDDMLVKRASEGNVLIESKSFAIIATNMDISCTAKIWLTASIQTRVKRRLGKDPDVKWYNYVFKYIKERRALIRRYNIDKNKYWDLYRADYSKPELYNDIVLDTSSMNEEDTFNLILKLLKDGGYIAK